MKKLILLLAITFIAAGLSAKVIYLTEKETFFTPQQFYFPGMKMPQKGALNLFLIYEMGETRLTDKLNNNKLYNSDISNKKIMLSYSVLSNLHMYIGRNLSNASYDLFNTNGNFVNAYNSVLNFLLTTYLPASQFNLLFPAGFSPILHPDRDRRDNLFGFTFKIADIPRYKLSTYFDYYQEDRDYRGIFYPIKYGIPPLPQTFMDIFYGIEDNHYRFLVSKDFKHNFTTYLGYENMRRRTSMYDGSYDDFHDYQTYLFKVTKDWDQLKASFSARSEGIGLSLEYQNNELFGMEVSYRHLKTPIQDDSNYFTSNYGQFLGLFGVQGARFDFEEEEQMLTFSFTQNF